MQLPSKIFIDGGDPEETRQADAMLKKAGFAGLDAGVLAWRVALGAF